MAKGYESQIIIYENDGWSGSQITLTDSYSPVLFSDELDAGLVTNERTSTVRNTRAHLESSFVNDDEYKPEGALGINPKLDTLPPVFRSHFQVVDYTETGSSFIHTFVPAKTPPLFSEGTLYGTGAYGVSVADVYCLDIKRKTLDSIGSSPNIQKFNRGICDELTIKDSAGEDVTIKADFKFKDFETLTTTASFGDSELKGYTDGGFCDWSHGTWSFSTPGGTNILDVIDDISEMQIVCSNNLVEKKSPGSNKRNSFSFGNYTVKGQFTTEYKYDEWYANQSEPFSIAGTIWRSNVDYMTVSIPRCFLKPFNKKLNNADSFIDAEVGFEAYEYDGTAPISVTLHVEERFRTTFWDAGFGARTLSEYDFADAGSTTRILADYNKADRDY